MQKLAGGITDLAARLTATVEENVLVQFEHLQTYPTVAAALDRKALNLRGRVYEFETGQVFGYHPQDGQFVPIEGTKLHSSIGCPRVEAHLGNIVRNCTSESPAHHREPMRF